MLKLSLKDIDDNISTKVSLFTDNTHLGQAYSEYCKKVKSNWEGFIGVVTSIIDKSYDFLSEPDIELNPNVVYNELVSIADDVFKDTNHNIVSLSESFLSTDDFCKYIAYLIMVDEEIPVSFPSFEWSESIVRNRSLTLDDVLRDINSIWHAVTVDSATAETLTLTEGLSISERLSAFRDVISRTFSSAFDDVSGYLGRSQDMIVNGLSAMEMWRENLADNGILGMSEGEITYPSESTNYQFHGVSPTSAYYWDTVADKVSSTVIGIGNALISGTNWLLNKGKQWISGLFKKAVNYVHEKVVDPQDLEIINDQGNYTVDTTFASNIFSVIMDKQSVLYKDMVINNKSICIETKFSENIIQRVKHSSGDTRGHVSLFENLVKAMRLWYLRENDISQVTLDDFNSLPNNVVALAAGIINHGTDEYDYSLSILENFQNSRFKLYTDAVDLQAIIRINFTLDAFEKVTLLCKTKYKPINMNIFFEVLKNRCMLINVPGLNNTEVKGLKLSDDAYEFISNMSDLYFTDATNEVRMYNSILASYVLDTIFWGDAIGDYSYYITFNRGQSSGSNLFQTGIFGYYLEDIYTICQATNTIDDFCNMFDQTAPLYKFVDTFDTEDAFIVGVSATKVNKDIGFKSTDYMITNLDYFNLCSLSNRVSVFNYQNVIDATEIYYHRNVQLPTLYELYIPQYSGCRGIIAMLTLYFSAFVQESTRPLDFKFIPYTTGRINFKNSMFRIRTDAENIQEFNNFVTGVGIGVIVAAIAITSIVVVKGIVKKSLIMRTVAKRKIENKVLNNEKLTKSDIKKYAKLNRKQSKLSCVVGNSVQASNVLSNDSILDANDRIISLIVGTQTA